MNMHGKAASAPADGSGRRVSAGYTIIELMIVVAVISALIVIAIPIYQSYTARAQLSEGMSVSSAVKQRISEVMTFGGSIPDPDPTVNEAMGLPKPGSIHGEYVSSVEVVKNDSDFEDGSILVTYRTASAFGSNNVHVIQPFFLTGSIKWDCASDANVVSRNTVIERFRPPVCRPSD